MELLLDGYGGRDAMIGCINDLTAEDFRRIAVDRRYPVGRGYVMLADMSEHNAVAVTHAISKVYQL